MDVFHVFKIGQMVPNRATHHIFEARFGDDSLRKLSMLSLEPLLAKLEAYDFQFILREKCPNTELFLVRILPHSV